MLKMSLNYQLKLFKTYNRAFQFRYFFRKRSKQIFWTIHVFTKEQMIIGKLIKIDEIG